MDKIRMKVRDDLLKQVIESLPHVRFLSCSPTPSGKRIQARVSYPFVGEKSFGYMAFDVSEAQKGCTILFGDFIEEIFRLRKRIRSSGMGLTAYSAYNAVIADIVQLLEDEGFESKTKELRIEIGQRLKDKVHECSAKKNKVELKNCRKNIPLWFHSAFKAGMEPEEIESMMKAALCKVILEQ